MGEFQWRLGKQNSQQVGFCGLFLDLVPVPPFFQKKKTRFHRVVDTKSSLRNAVNEMEGLEKPSWLPDDVYRFIMFKD